MIDLGALFREMSDELLALEKPVFPEIPGKTEASGKEQPIDNNDFSRVSRFPGRKQETYIADFSFEKKDINHTIADYPENANSCSRVKGYVSAPGKRETPGNASNDIDLPFPVSSFKNGKTGKENGPCEEPFYSPTPDTPEAWREACALFSPSDPPCPGFRSDEWRRALRVLDLFLDQHAHTAHDLGWSTLDLFGVNPDVGVARVDHCGALMLSSGEPIRAVEADAIVFRNTKYRRRSLPPGVIPVWTFDNAERPQ